MDIETILKSLFSYLPSWLSTFIVLLIFILSLLPKILDLIKDWQSDKNKLSDDLTKLEILKTKYEIELLKKNLGLKRPKFSGVDSLVAIQAEITNKEKGSFDGAKKILSAKDFLPVRTLIYFSTILIPTIVFFFLSRLISPNGFDFRQIDWLFVFKNVFLSSFLYWFISLFYSGDVLTKDIKEIINTGFSNSMLFNILFFLLYVFK